jgi:hypothetical protein
MIDKTEDPAGLEVLGKLSEIVHQQREIIEIQSGVIEELFGLLAQHITAEEADRLPVVARINEAARIRKEMGEGI